MSNFQNTLLSLFSDFFINLSAGFFGATIILPLSVRGTRVSKFILLYNLMFAIILFGLALFFRLF